jgi:hypothetical protein
MYNAPTNTSKESPLMFLAEAMLRGSSEGMIERQESRGQSEFVKSDTLPANVKGDAKKCLESAGVKFLGPVDGDELFQFVELPHGWERKPTEHSMWSELFDEKGRIRATIFYKAAFYDRESFLNIRCRFGVFSEYSGPNDNTVTFVVKDGDDVIFSSSPYERVDSDWRKNDENDCAARLAAVSFLDRKFPEWKDPSKYWD